MFAEDSQNVHRSRAVVQTKAILAGLLAIPVPPEYRWNVSTVSKTVGEVLLECSLGINAARIMMDKYTLSDDIYDMGEGIYGRALDGLWQYIKGAGDRAGLCSILGAELRVNVGTCLQGQLSRLCSVVAGYVEWAGSQESSSEELGREFALMVGDADVPGRVARGERLLDEHRVVEPAQREAWLAALREG